MVLGVSSTTRISAASVGVPILGFLLCGSNVVPPAAAPVAKTVSLQYGLMAVTLEMVTAS